MKRKIKLTRRMIGQAVDAIRKGTPFSRVPDVIPLTRRTLHNYLNRGEKIVYSDTNPDDYTPDEVLLSEFYNGIKEAQFYWHFESDDDKTE